MKTRVTRPPSRAERLIASGRVALAIVALVATRFDGAPAHRLAGPFLLLFAGYALLLAVWSFAPVSYGPRVAILSHSIDLASFALINILTDPATSPFFAYLVFSIVCAILRFGRAGTFATAGAALLAFLLPTEIAHLGGAAIDWSRFVIRTGYLAVIASMLVYTAEYQQRTNRELARIAAWPRAPWSTLEAVVQQMLEQGAAVLGSKRVLIAFEDDADRRAFLATATNDGFQAAALPRTDAEALLRDASTAAAAPAPSRGNGKVPGSTLSVSFEGDLVRGRVFFLDRSTVMEEDLALGRTVSDIMAQRLDHYLTTQQLRRGAAAEERVRLARNLHDSLLQSLTGAALQLQTLPRIMIRDPQEASARVSEIQQALAADQRELRGFIDALQSEGSFRHQYDVAARLEALRERFRQHWAMELEIHVDPSLRLLPTAMHIEIYSIVSEAVANAAKHARAKGVRVDVSRNGASVAVTVVDDGGGFPFRGRFTLAELFAADRGPVKLKERVASLGGDMSIDSSAHGSRVEVTVPVSG